jgi:hypothetical protein
MSLIFFDNRPEEVTDMVQGIAHAQGVYVSDHTPHPRLSGGRTTDYPKTFPGNEYARIVLRAGGEEIMPSLGLTAEHMESLVAWVQREPIRPLIAAFDWDRTLTVVEGVILPGNREWDEVGWPWSPSDTLVYLFGGAERLQMIQDMFTWLHAEGVDVFIVTRNLNVVEAKGAFFDLVRRLDPSFSYDHLIYAGDQKKSEALRGNREYRIIMAPVDHQVGRYLQGGRRRRSRSRRARKRNLKTRRG